MSTSRNSLGLLSAQSDLCKAMSKAFCLDKNADFQGNQVKSSPLIMPIEKIIDEKLSSSVYLYDPCSTQTKF